MTDTFKLKFIDGPDKGQSLNMPISFKSYILQGRWVSVGKAKYIFSKRIGDLYYMVYSGKRTV